MDKAQRPCWWHDDGLLEAVFMQMKWRSSGRQGWQEAVHGDNIDLLPLGMLDDGMAPAFCAYAQSLITQRL
jgi:hypothetical protein